MIYASGGSTDEWFGNNIISNNKKSEISIKPTKNSQSTVVVSSEYNCKASALIIICIEDPVTNIKIPDAFSPNNDGVNDFFGPYNFSGIESFKMIIYNRFGEKMYETENINSPLDGKYKGVEQPIGVYLLIINGTSFGNKTLKRAGSLTLIR